ncbi:hypothetical protein CCO03_16950 [Comamonas serinivorans]|uniref:Uncharacterized protein n=1 Tax=Comamonas serinivorans TaxID=1082851 RepID=A0A1Y0ER46_9BURK|nr:hypothetical protein [Comamonas serinivorans]ARU06134.1 hypothetical protein CCO03_16950 [Comamonas serinivorans]
MPQLFANGARTVLEEPLGATGSAVNLPAGVFPWGTMSDWFRLVFEDATDPTQFEVVTAFPAMDHGEYTLQRAQEGTTARDWPAGTIVGLRVTAADMAGTAIERGGTGATTLAAAQTNLGIDALKDVPQTIITSVYDLALTDRGKSILSNGSTVRIPTNSSVAFPIGTTIIVVNDSGSTVNILNMLGTNAYANGVTTGAGQIAYLKGRSMATLHKVAINTWYLSGNFA